MNQLTDKGIIMTSLEVAELTGKEHKNIMRDIRNEIEELKKSEIKYKALDETVLLAILVSRQALKNAGWKHGDNFGINIGSSRGATQLFEKHHKEFLETGKTSTLA